MAHSNPMKFRDSCKMLPAWVQVSLTVAILLLASTQLAWVNQPRNEQKADLNTPQAALTSASLQPTFWITSTPGFSPHLINLITRRLALLMKWMVWLAAAGFLFALPGWALLSLVLPSWNALDFWEKLAIGSGVGLSFQFLLFLWTDLIGAHLGSMYAWAPGALSLPIILWSNFKRLKALPSNGFKIRLPDWQWLFAGLVVALVFSIRLLAIRNLTAPMWGDSVQHTTIAQLMLDHGGLFQSWLPYTPYITLSVHYGFSSAVALFSWLLSIDSMQATLVAGQILNGLAILCLYPLAMRLSNGNRLAGIGTLIAAGLLFKMPAYYVNYGRYAQLTGQVILPIGLWLLWETIDPRPDENQKEIRPTLRQIVLAGITLAGMFLAYYRTPFFYASFGFLLFVISGLPRWNQARRSVLKETNHLVQIGLISFLLLVPWIPRLAGSNLADAVGAGISRGKQFELILIDFQAWRDIAFYAPLGLLLLAGAAILWALYHRRWLIAALGLWFPILVAYLAGQMIRLPGANMLQTFALLIALYMPVSLLAGWLIGELGRQLNSTNQLGPSLMGALLLLAGIWGWVSQIDIAQPEHFGMVEKQDLKAGKWIRSHTPSEAIFLIEGFSVYNGSSAVGSDAGWWLPIIAGRQTNIPPQYAQFNEQPQIPGYTKQVADLVVAFEQQPPNAPENLQRLCSFGISHVYVGQKQGLVGLGAHQLFSPDQLLGSPEFKLTYHQDQVYIFELVACEVER